MATPATKSTRSSYWFVRVDGPLEFLREKCKEHSQHIDVVAMLAAYHVGQKKENPHCHFVVQLSSSPQKQSYAVRLKGLFAIEKRTQYALDTWDGNRGAGACSYLYHEDGAEILVNKGFTEQELADARSANIAVQRVIAVNKEKASNKFVDKAIAHFKEGSVTNRELLSYFMRLCKDGECYWPGVYRAKQLIEEVRIKMADDQDFENLVDEMEFKMFH